MDDLIARLEAASEGSRELDARVIASVVGGEAAISRFNGMWCVFKGTDRRGEPAVWEPRSDWDRNVWRSMSGTSGPTTSLDAALTLVPEGCAWMVRSGDYAKVWLPDRKPPGNDFDAIAASPIIALCIAALKARNAAVNQT